MFDSQVFPDSTVEIGLNLGCGSGGTCFREPYINLDINRKKNFDGWMKKKESPKPIYFMVADAEKLPFKDESFDEVYASHLLEHFNWNFVIKTLKEWYRVTKKDGRIKVCVPDFKRAVDIYTGKEIYKDQGVGGLTARNNGVPYSIKGPIFQTIYGWISIENSTEVGHKCIFDEELLSWCLSQAGFKNIQPAKIHSCPYRVIRNEVCLVATK